MNNSSQDIDYMNSLLLVAHGSRREASNDEIRSLTAELQRVAGNAFANVSCAFLELAEPSIPDGIRQCIERGATCVTVFPYFLSAGRHVASDIPAEVSEISHDYPEIEITIAPYLGAASSMSELILQQAGLTLTHRGE
ncbi:MAG: CbiX/SirB N-terminal domain-containing protein [Halobacteria archaeon]|nr:CbiX/SirB N-terminal domain-containing protein [Halobacteria archaeon]